MQKTPDIVYRYLMQYLYRNPSRDKPEIPAFKEESKNCL